MYITEVFCMLVKFASRYRLGPPAHRHIYYLAGIISTVLPESSCYFIAAAVESPNGYVKGQYLRTFGKTLML